MAAFVCFEIKVLFNDDERVKHPDVSAHCEAVSQAADSYEITRARWIVLDLLPEPVDVYHDRVFVDNGFAPYYAVYHVLREDMIHIVDEQFDHRVLFG